MNCLHCGDCCNRFSPLTNDEHRPCPKVKQDGTFFFCGDYENRPERCYKHKFDCRFCPVGMDTLGLKDPQAAYMRIEQGYMKLKGPITGAS